MPALAWLPPPPALRFTHFDVGFSALFRSHALPQNAPLPARSSTQRPTSPAKRQHAPHLRVAPTRKSAAAEHERVVCGA
jgi:hypothetical protein